MTMRLTVNCDVCYASSIEKTDGGGFPGWGALQGVALDGVTNPNLCPEHLTKAAGFIDKMKKENGS